LIDDSESRLAHEANAPIAAVSIGETRADSILSLKINARCGEVRASYFEFELLSDTAYDSLWFSFALLQHLLQILPRILQMGSLAVPNLS
jgi:NAD-dependent deacetylase sirtuin 4